MVFEGGRGLLTPVPDAIAADGAAKRMLKIDRRFSFAAAEIRRFVKPVAHGDHKIDVESARQVWNEEKPSLERRAALLEMLVAAQDGGGRSGAAYVQAAGSGGSCSRRFRTRSGARIRKACSARCRASSSPGRCRRTS